MFLQEFPNIYEQLSKSNKTSGHTQVSVRSNLLLIVETFLGFGILLNFPVNSKTFLLILISQGIRVLLSFANISLHTLFESNEKPNHDY